MALDTDSRQSFIESLTLAVNASGIRSSVYIPSMVTFGSLSLTQHRFDLSIDGLGFAPNYENNRWFLVMRVTKPRDDSLNKLLHISNAVAQAYGQPPLYTDHLTDSTRSLKRRKKIGETSGNNNSSPQRVSNGTDIGNKISRDDMSSHFHISIGWLLVQPLKEVEEKLESLGTQRFSDYTLKVNAIKVKIGNAVTTISLLSKMDGFKAFLER